MICITSDWVYNAHVKKLNKQIYKSDFLMHV